MMLHAIYYRISKEAFDTFRETPELLLRHPLEQPLREGRAIDLGRGWEELGCLLEGGIRTPETGPTVGDVPLIQTEEGVHWSAITPDGVATYREGLLGMGTRAFFDMLSVDEAETADRLPEDHTGEHGERGHYLYERYRRLQHLFESARTDGNAILVRLGPQRRTKARET